METVEGFTIHKMGVFEAWELHRIVSADILLAFDGAENMGQRVAILTAFLSRLDKPESRAVWTMCLSHVSREDHKNRLIVDGVFAYEDIGIFTIDSLIVSVIADALGAFTAELATHLPGVPVRAKAKNGQS